MVLVILVSLCGWSAAETWHLKKEAGWQPVSQDEHPGTPGLAAARFKKLVGEGDAEAAREALAALKAGFPDISPPGFDAFTEAEMLFAAGKFDRACRKYDKFLDKYPQSELWDAALERQFQIGTAYLAGYRRVLLKVFKMRAYGEGIKIMDKIAERAGDSSVALRALTAAARSYEARGKFIEAYHKWSELSSLWPTGEVGQEALLGKASCMHAAYGGPKYDAGPLLSARQYYQEFKLRYPQQAQQLGVDTILAQIEEQIAYKQYMTGRYYARTGSVLAANLYYRQVEDDWPNSTAARFARETKARSESR
jgi:outer membrane protein assembly factor BamD (BamD/ComL family)